MTGYACPPVSCPTCHCQLECPNCDVGRGAFDFPENFFEFFFHFNFVLKLCGPLTP